MTIQFSWRMWQRGRRYCRGYQVDVCAGGDGIFCVDVLLCFDRFRVQFKSQSPLPT